MDFGSFITLQLIGRCQTSHCQKDFLLTTLLLSIENRWRFLSFCCHTQFSLQSTDDILFERRRKMCFFLLWYTLYSGKGHDARRHHKGRRKMCCVFKKRTSVIRLIECPKDFLRNALRSVKVLQYDNFVKIVRLPLHLLKISRLHEERFLNRF